MWEQEVSFKGMKLKYILLSGLSVLTLNFSQVSGHWSQNQFTEANIPKPVAHQGSGWIFLVEGEAKAEFLQSLQTAGKLRVH